MDGFVFVFVTFLALTSHQAAGELFCFVADVRKKEQNVNTEILTFKTIGGLFVALTTFV